MKKRLSKYLFVSFVPLIAGGILYMNCSTKSQEDRSPESVPSTESTVHIKDTPLPTPEDVSEYWTPERMRDAKPIPFPDAVIPQDGRSTDTDINATTGSIPGTAPDNHADHKPEKETPDGK